MHPVIEAEGWNGPKPVLRRRRTSPWWFPRNSAKNPKFHHGDAEGRAGLHGERKEYFASPGPPWPAALQQGRLRQQAGLERFLRGLTSMSSVPPW